MMGDWKSLVLKTGVDKLLELIISADEISVGEASRELGVKPSVIESWAGALAEDNMITTTYNSLGELMFKSTKENMKVKEGKINQLKDEIGTTLKSVGTDLSEEEKTLSVSKDHIRSFERILKTDINEIESFKKNMKNYEQKKTEISRVIKKLKEEEAALENNAVRIEDQEKKLLTESERINDTINTKIIDVNSAKKNIIELEQAKDELKRNFEILKRISFAMQKAPPEKIGPKIEEIEKRTGNLKTHNSLIKQKFEKLGMILKNVFR